MRAIKSVAERFWSKVDKSGNCWFWTGARIKAGYGELNVGGKPKYAHVISYEFAFGPVPFGLEIDHLCRNRACVNPEHLEAVPHRVNMLRGETVGARNAAVTHCPMGHPYSGSNLHINRRGGRICRSCWGRWRKKVA